LYELIFAILKVIYLISCAFLVITVLLQSGKGGGLAAAFGGGGGVDSAFGAKVGGPLRKATALFATLFMVLAIVLAIMMSMRPGGPVGAGKSSGVIETIDEAPDAEPADDAPADNAPADNAPADDAPAEDDGALLLDGQDNRGVA